MRPQEFLKSALKVQKNVNFLLNSKNFVEILKLNRNVAKIIHTLGKAFLVPQNTPLLTGVNQGGILNFSK